MNTLCWLKQQDYLLSLVKEDKKKKLFFKEIENFREYLVTKQQVITSNYYFFIINSYFSKCVATDVDIVLIPKKEINLDLLSIFYEDLNVYLKELLFKEKCKIFDIQTWNLPLEIFIKEYNFNEPIVHGKYIFKKYSLEQMTSLPGTKKLNNYLYERSSDIFTQKHFERQENNIKYINPVALFEIDKIDPASYRTFKHKLQLIERILNSTNYPDSCSNCKLLHDGYENEYNKLIQDSSCPACKKNSLKTKYINAIYKSFYL
jgi:hypothetical protein